MEKWCSYYMFTGALIPNEWEITFTIPAFPFFNSTSCLTFKYCSHWVFTVPYNCLLMPLSPLQEDQASLETSILPYACLYPQHLGYRIHLGYRTPPQRCPERMSLNNPFSFRTRCLDPLIASLAITLQPLTDTSLMEDVPSAEAGHPYAPLSWFALSPYARQAWEVGCAHKECIWFQVRKLRSSSVDLWHDSLG